MNASFQPVQGARTVSPSQAFALEVLALRPALVAFARRLCREEADAEDLVQTTLLKALRAEALYKPGTRLRSWLFTIMRNTFNTRVVRARREVLPGPDMIEAALSTPATQGTDLWAAEGMRHLFDDLSPAHREVLILIPVLGLAYEDAAEVCGCTVGTVKSRLSRARAALARLADGVGP